MGGASNFNSMFLVFSIAKMECHHPHFIKGFSFKDLPIPIISHEPDLTDACGWTPPYDWGVRGCPFRGDFRVPIGKP